MFRAKLKHLTKMSNQTTYYEGCIVSLNEENLEMRKHLKLGKFDSIDEIFDYYDRTEFDLDFKAIKNPYVVIAIHDEREEIEVDCCNHGCSPGLRLEFYKLEI